MPRVTRSSQTQCLRPISQGLVDQTANGFLQCSNDESSASPMGSPSSSQFTTTSSSQVTRSLPARYRDHLNRVTVFIVLLRTLMTATMGLMDEDMSVVLFRDTLLTCIFLMKMLNNNAEIG
ncbi:hypothetical protein C5167_039727 [Papaver somniferum]|uniref:Uncharacterized protein n=1 Tax=Papaver somniferum TaxID=3469 RepID=A0A4Y7IH89_PAPSO|nr:hypothetical protein C5167_039727 [Papaver somniferum]